MAEPVVRIFRGFDDAVSGRVARRTITDDRGVAWLITPAVITGAKNLQRANRCQ